MPNKDTKGPRKRSPRPSEKQGGLEKGSCGEKWVIQEIVTAEYPTKVKNIEFFDSKEEAKERFNQLKGVQQATGRPRRYMAFTYPEKMSEKELKRLQHKNITENVKKKLDEVL